MPTLQVKIQWFIMSLGTLKRFWLALVLVRTFSVLRWGACRWKSDVVAFRGLVTPTLVCTYAVFPASCSKESGEDGKNVPKG